MSGNVDKQKNYANFAFPYPPNIESFSTHFYRRNHALVIYNIQYAVRLGESKNRTGRSSGQRPAVAERQGWNANILIEV